MYNSNTYSKIIKNFQKSSLYGVQNSKSVTLHRSCQKLRSHVACAGGVATWYKILNTSLTRTATPKGGSMARSCKSIQIRMFKVHTRICIIQSLPDILVWESQRLNIQKQPKILEHNIKQYTKFHPLWMRKTRYTQKTSTRIVGNI